MVCCSVHSLFLLIFPRTTTVIDGTNGTPPRPPRPCPPPAAGGGWRARPRRARRRAVCAVDDGRGPRKNQQEQRVDGAADHLSRGERALYHRGRALRIAAAVRSRESPLLHL